MEIYDVFKFYVFYFIFIYDGRSVDLSKLINFFLREFKTEKSDEI